MKIVIHNTSRVSDKEARWLIHFAAVYVRNVAEREGWLAEFESATPFVRLTNCRWAYRGRFMHRYRGWALNKAYGSVTPHTEDAKLFWNILLRIGKPSHFPCDSTYPRFKDMPEERVVDWQEGLIDLTAHEFSHIRYSGRREGEFNCELIASDCLTMFRRDRQQYEAFMQAGIRKEEEKAQRLAANCSPDAVKARKLAKAEADLKRWQRKAKLAATKIKKLNRRLAGLRRNKPNEA